MNYCLALTVSFLKLKAERRSMFFFFLNTNLCLLWFEVATSEREDNIHYTISATNEGISRLMF